jgi:hypothetical protein
LGSAKGQPHKVSASTLKKFEGVLTGAIDAVVLDAYAMCNGQDNALPNTHATIVATLIEQSSMPSIFLVSPATTTAAQSPTFSTSTQPTSTSISSTSSTSTSSSTISTSASTSASSSSDLITASGSPTLFPTASQPLPVTSATATPTPTPTLTKPQIVGVTVASVGVGALGLGLILLFACWKRRKARKDRDSDLLPFQSDPSNFVNYSNYAKSTKSSKSKFGFSPFRPAGRREIGPGATSNGVAAKIPPRVPPRLDTQSPNMFSRKSIKPDTIGIAISPENQVQRQRQRTSKLLPEKPTLRLQTPPRATNNPGVGPSGLSFSQPAPAPAPRQSTATQFEEDEDSAVTGGARDTWGRADQNELETAIGNWQTVRNVNPNPPPAAFSVTGGDGNHWRQARDSNNNPSAPEYYVKPLTIQRGVGSFSQPRRPDEYPRPARQQSSSPLDAFPAPPASDPYPQKLRIPTGQNTATSSVYSTHTSSLPAGEPSPLSRQQKKYKQVGPYDTHKSSGSMTSFESNDSFLKTPTPKTPRTGEGPLSPVAESPTSGRSPVSYPKIPKLGRLPESTIRMIPPPPQPNFGSVMAKPPPPKPDFGSVMVKPWRAAELEAASRRRDEELEAQREAVYQTQTQAQLQREHVGAQYQERRQSLIELQLPLQGHGLTLPERTSSRSRHNAAIPPSSMGLNSLPSQNKAPPRGPGFGLPVGPRPKRLPGPGQQPVNTQPPITFTRSSSALSHISEGSSNASNISLLAKRRGEQKAAALTLNGDATGSGKGGKWRVLKEGDIEAAKSPTWRPMLSSSNNARGEERTRVLERMEPVELPGTPGWVPRLTPTRRGDELFISVQ